MKNLFFAFMFCVTSVALFAASEYESANAPFIPKTKTLSKTSIPLRYVTESLIVDVTLMGKQCSMLVDTGASHSVFDTKFVKENFPNVKMQAVRAEGGNVDGAVQTFDVSDLKIAGTTLKNFRAVSYDLSGLKASLGLEKDLNGVLGMNLLTLSPIRISYKAKTLQWLLPKDVKKISNKKELPAQMDSLSGLFVVDVTSPRDGVKYKAIIDSGSNVTCVPLMFWNGEQKETGKVKITNVHETDKIMDVVFGIPDTLKFGKNFELKDVTPSLYNDSAHMMLIGGDVLSRFDLIIDRQNKKVYAVPEK